MKNINTQTAAAFACTSEHIATSADLECDRGCFRDAMLGGLEVAAATPSAWQQPVHLAAAATSSVACRSTVRLDASDEQLEEWQNAERDWVDAQLEMDLREASAGRTRRRDAARNRVKGEVTGWFTAILAAATFGVLTPEGAFRGGTFGRVSGVTAVGLAKGLDDLDSDDTSDV